MFPFRQSCEFSFQVSENNQEDQIHHTYEAADMNTDSLASITDAATPTKPAMATTDVKRKREVEGPWQAMKFDAADHDLGLGDDATKKTQHRDNERQRRLVMASLLNTLRSLLPLELVKGKRSASDHISETVNYIKHLEKSVKELQGKRDRLRTLMQSNSDGTPCFREGTSLSSITSNNVNICITNIGLEIQISSTGKIEDEFRLSEVFKVLLEEGTSVVCSVSGKVDGIFHHNIQCQVSDNIDIQRLQQRLYDVENKITQLH